MPALSDGTHGVDQANCRYELRSPFSWHLDAVKSHSRATQRPPARGSKEAGKLGPCGRDQHWIENEPSRDLPCVQLQQPGSQSQTCRYGSSYYDYLYGRGDTRPVSTASGWSWLIACHMQSCQGAQQHPASSIQHPVERMVWLASQPGTETLHQLPLHSTAVGARGSDQTEAQRPLQVHCRSSGLGHLEI